MELLEKMEMVEALVGGKDRMDGWLTDYDGGKATVVVEVC